MDVTTHLRGRVVQAGAFLALAIGGLAVAPAIALAAAPGDPSVQIQDVAPTSVASGGKVTMHYTVTNGNLLDTDQNGADIKVTGMDCNCDQFVTINKGDSKQFTAQLTAPTVPDGETQQVQIQVRVTINNRTASASSPTVTIKGNDKPKTVRQISGKVKDQDGKAISGARVVMQDSAGNQYDTISNNSGSYTFTSNDGQPIVPGKITVGAGKEGFEARSVEVQGSADRTVNVPLTLKATVTASPSASESPSASASVSPPPADVLQTAAPAAPAASVAATANTAANQKDSGGSTMFIVLGGLLVAAGIGAIVLVMMRRKNNSGGDDDPDGFGGPGGGGPMPSGPGRYPDQTRVGAPMGGGRADATMVAPMSGAPSLADAPTMLHRPVPAVEDEFPDPYGVPIPQQGGYAGTNNWDNQPGGYGTEAAQYGAGAYGANGQYVQEPADDPYAAYNAAPSGGYDNAPAAAVPGRRYDEPTGMYRPESTPDADAGYGAAGYDQHDGYGAGAQQYGGQYAAQPEPTGTYGAQPEPANGYHAGGYDQEPVDEQAGYGSWGAPGSGIDSGNAYGPQSGGAYGAAPQQPQYGGGYGADPAGAYNEPTGYDQQAPYGGYEQQQPPAYDEPGYDQRPGYGEQGGGRRGGQPPQRRPPEWDN